MATTFPTSLQDLDATRGTATDKLSSPDHVTHHTLEDDTIEALQTKVGIDSSAVTTTIDYKLTNASSSNPGHKHTLVAGATDVTATASEINTVCDGYSWAAPNTIGSTTPNTGVFTTLEVTAGTITTLNNLTLAYAATGFIIAGGTTSKTLTLDANLTASTVLATTSFVNNETPTGTIDGSNKSFTLANTPNPAASLQLLLNGAFQTAGGEDYTLSGTDITFVNAPPPTSVLRAFYMK